MGTSWRDNLLLTDREAIVSKMPLRFDLPWVPISAIAQQFYCEVKVDHEYKFGKVPTPEKEEGTVLHEEIIEMEPVTVEELVKSIEKKPICFCTFPVFGKIDGLTMFGIPDAILFRKSIPSHLIELKTTNGDVSRLWRDQVVQVKAYAMALDLMGFQCGGLGLSLVRVNKNGISAEAKDTMLNAVAEGLLDGQVESVEASLNRRFHSQLKVHRLAYNKEDALKDVMWARDYWVMKRDPIPTRNAAKCKACEFNEKCPFSLVTAAGKNLKLPGGHPAA